MASKPLKDHRGRSVRTYSATTAKNSFGTLLDDAARYGVVGITKRDQARFVVLSIEEYASLQPPTLDELEGEFDRRVAAMQTPEARSARRALLDASDAALSRVPVEPDTVKKTKRR